MSESLFECTSFKLGCNAQNDKCWAWTYAWTSDVDMSLFFEKGMREGVSHISKRYSKTNNQ